MEFSMLTCNTTCVMEAGSPPPMLIALKAVSKALMVNGKRKHSRLSQGDQAVMAYNVQIILNGDKI